MQLHKPFATVTPTLDGDVLAVLASADAAFTVSQIQRMLPTTSGEGIRKVLKRLTTQGVVLDSQVGRTGSYRLNTEHLAAEPILALSQLASSFLGRLERHLESWFPEGKELRYAAVFGSAATGRMTLSSDIDLLLVRTSASENRLGSEEMDSWDERVTELARVITAWTGNDARVVEYTEDGLAAAAAAGEPLLHEVAKQGLTVAGSRAWLSKQLRPGGDATSLRRR